ncbi:MAG: hypothetical protein JSS93_12425 [Bacteroidetes bacterium]|nr:hypothetical protein [Bacteroidota bacterium]
MKPFIKYLFLTSILAWGVFHQQRSFCLSQKAKDSLQVARATEVLNQAIIAKTPVLTSDQELISIEEGEEERACTKKFFSDNLSHSVLLPLLRSFSYCAPEQAHFSIHHIVVFPLHSLCIFFQIFRI